MSSVIRGEAKYVLPIQTGFLFHLSPPVALILEAPWFCLIHYWYPRSSLGVQLASSLPECSAFPISHIFFWVLYISGCTDTLTQFQCVRLISSQPLDHKNRLVLPIRSNLPSRTCRWSAGFPLCSAGFPLEHRPPEVV